MKLFKKKILYDDPVEARFGDTVDIVKDLSKADYTRWKKATELAWEAYQEMKKVKTDEEKAEAKMAKECEDVDTLDKMLEKSK